MLANATISGSVGIRGSHTFAIFQCEFGAQTPKPTRFVTDLSGFEGPTHSGSPQFNKNWKYQGPLPTHCPRPDSHEQLIGQDAQGNWKTGPAAHYPGPLCLFLAKAIVATWHQSSVASVESSLTSGDSRLKSASLNDSFNHREMGTADQQTLDQGHSNLALEALDMDVEEVAIEQCNVVVDSGCIGPPLVASYAGRSEEFCDGFGLCSPGRWHPNNRSKKRLPEQLAFCRGLRKMVDEFCERVMPDLGKGIMKLALGRCQQSPFSSVELQSLRESWFRSLPDPHRAAQVTEGQPFFLHALAQSLRLMGDLDVDSIYRHDDWFQFHRTSACRPYFTFGADSTSFST